MYAREIRSQVKQSGPCNPRTGPYPKRYLDEHSNLPLKGTPPFSHMPVISGQDTPYVNGSGRPGAFRAIYEDDRREDFQVVYHDSKKPIPMGSSQHPYTMANYHLSVPGPLLPKAKGLAGKST